MKKILIILFLILLSQVGVASEDKPSILLEGGMQTLLIARNDFVIEIIDQVSGGCLPRPSRLKDKL